MKYPRIVLILVLATGVDVFSQPAGVAPLFLEEGPLSMELGISMKQMKKSSSDTVYFPTLLRYKNEQGTWDSLRIRVRARGNFRRKYCNFPPLRIKISKTDARGSVFAGTKNLKLVIPCQTAKSYQELIFREFLCYKLFEPITRFAFSTRLVNMKLTDLDSKSGKKFELTGFFIEDDDAVARRLDAVAKDDVKLHPMHLQDTNALRLDHFQYMIANSDFSTTFLHNVKVLQTKSNQKIALPYDFDMAGLVNASYATFDESLGIQSVRERVYKGFCRDEQLSQYVRQEFVRLEPTFKEVISHYGHYFDAKELAGIQKFIDSFFEILGDDSYYRTNILLKCRER